MKLETRMMKPLGRQSQRVMSLAMMAALIASVLLLPGRAQAQDATTEPLPALPDYTPVSMVQLKPDDPAAVSEEAADESASSASVLSPDALTNPSFLPVTFQDHTLRMADRMGYTAASKSIGNYSDIRYLRGGWYMDWGVRNKPSRPGGLTFVQMVRVHQKLTCPNGTTADRTICPYATPAAYEITQTPDQIKAAAKRNPGSLWLIGNEIDRMDWEGGQQDEITPQVYAQAYHDMYQLIKGADSTARVAIAGVIQFTPLRQKYLELVLSTYEQKWGKMPIDVWNVHNFIGLEYCRIEKVNKVDTRRCYGMGIPPGVDVAYNANKEQRGSYVGQDWLHTDMATFAAQIENMRAWMKTKGYADKPLIVTEYGVLFKTLCQDGESLSACKSRLGSHYIDLTDPNVVQSFMLDTFDYFANKSNTSVSGVDGGRLVQMWAWFGLDDIGWDFNVNGTLLDAGTGKLTTTGQKYADFTNANWQKLSIGN